MKVTIHAAKTNLSKLIEQVHAGEEVVIARGDVPVARLVPIVERLPTRQAGTLRGLVKVTDAFFEPLSPEELVLLSKTRAVPGWRERQSQRQS